MKVAEFNYKLPVELIAQTPSGARDESRLMVLDRKSGEIQAALFKNLPGFLLKNDLLVVNDSRVIPCRLYGKKGTGAEIEILLLKKREDTIWEALLRPGKRVRENTIIYFGPDIESDVRGEARVIKKLSEKAWLLEFKTETDFESFLKQKGRAPLPPYIKRSAQNDAVPDIERYQTVYAKVPGSVAAPTAGLHFTPDVLAQLRNHGIGVAEITLHVGYGTFLPITAENVEDHVMEEEFFQIGEQSAADINRAQRVIAVGTTSTRVLESVADGEGRIKATSGSTKLFIYPGYRFKRVEGLITNFHLPKSSLFILAAAFAGKDNLLRAYERAIREKFRFYSYGDCMLII